MGFEGLGCIRVCGGSKGLVMQSLKGRTRCNRCNRVVARRRKLSDHNACNSSWPNATFTQTTSRSEVTYCPSSTFSLASSQSSEMLMPSRSTQLAHACGTSGCAPVGFRPTRPKFTTASSAGSGAPVCSREWCQCEHRSAVRASARSETWQCSPQFAKIVEFAGSGESTGA